MTTILIDGDGLLYRACKAVEIEEQFGPNHHVLFSSFHDAKDKYNRLLEDLLDNLSDVDDLRYKVYLSGSHNWRYQVLPSYKSNRVDRKPLCYARTKEWLLDDCSAVMESSMEADDLIAMVMSTYEDCAAVSQDKDFYSVPGKFIRLDGDMNPQPTALTTPPSARFNHLVQAVAGDRVDGYYGCKGYGPKKSVKFLNDLVSVEDEIQVNEIQDVWKEVEDLFTASGHEMGEAKVNATVAHLIHDDSGVDRPWLIDYGV